MIRVPDHYKLFTGKSSIPKAAVHESVSGAGELMEIRFIEEYGTGFGCDYPRPHPRIRTGFVMRVKPNMQGGSAGESAGLCPPVFRGFLIEILLVLFPMINLSILQVKDDRWMKRRYPLNGPLEF
jgi:hypothetical protein